MSAFVHESAELGSDVTLGAGTAVWHRAQIREDVTIGKDCVIGGGTYIGPGVRIGDATKIQNQCLIYDPAEIGSGVFIGPGVILTNDRYPRSVEPDMTPKRAGDWTAQGVTVGGGASVGAGSVLLAGVTVGEWALIGAGSTVIRDVPAFAMVAGSPARFKAWVGRTGRRLTESPDSIWVCGDTGDRFKVTGDALSPVGA